MSLSPWSVFLQKIYVARTKLMTTIVNHYFYYYISPTGGQLQSQNNGNIGLYWYGKTGVVAME